MEKIHSAKRLAFIQCVGSRDMRFNRYCSSFCCMHAIKEAIIAREHDAEVEVLLFGMDIRAVGKGFEEYRNRGGREAGIQYIRSRVAEITQDRNFNPVVWYEDTKKRETTHLTVDLVILATACEPSKGARQLAEIAGVELNEFGFFKTDPFTAAGYDTARRFCLRLRPGPDGHPGIGGTIQQHGGSSRPDAAAEKHARRQPANGLRRKESKPWKTSGSGFSSVIVVRISAAFWT